MTNSPTRYPTAETLAGQRRQVYEGRALMTRGGLTKSDLKQDKDGKIISKAASKASKRRSSPLKAWVAASRDACDELDLYCDIGTVKKGTKVYKLAKKIYRDNGY